MIEEFLIYFMILELLNLGNLIAKITLMLSNLFLLDFQQGRYLHIAFGICLARTKSDNITNLGAIEQFLLIIDLDIFRHHHSCLNGNTTFHSITFSIKLTKVALHHIALFIYLAVHILTSLRCEHVNLLINKLIINLDLVVIYCILVGQFDAELRCDSNIEHEGIWSFLF